MRRIPPSPADILQGAVDVRHFLSEPAEQEVLAVLCEQFRHEQRITSDDVRFVVRSVAGNDGALVLPPDFPPMRWILSFKRANGFTQLGGSFAIGLPERLDVKRCSSSSLSCVTSPPSDEEQDQEQVSRWYSAAATDTSPCLSLRPSYDSDPQLQLQLSRQQHQQQQQQHQRRSMVVDDRRAVSSWQRDPEEPSSNSSNNSVDSEIGATSGASSNSSASATPSVGAAKSDDNAAEKRGYRLSHTVPAETWEKAIAAVEQQGMSLRAAAKVYGVHFAALHRRVKKRAQGGQSAKGNSAYFHPSDEAGITRVVVARAELGVLMTFDELMKLVETAALRKLPDISVDAARKLLLRFQSRNEQSIRHIIEDWPPPAITTPSGASQPQHYRLEHPGYVYDTEPKTPSVPRLIVPPRSALGAGGTATAAVVAASPPSLFQPPDRLGPFSPGRLGGRAGVLPLPGNVKTMSTCTPCNKVSSGRAPVTYV